jgi:HlyD family secretion protein
VKRFIITILVLGAVATVAFFSYQFANQPVQQEQAQTVEGETVVVIEGTIAETVSSTGRVLPEKQALVGFETSGRVKEVLVEQGQRVKKGDVLARLETDDLEMALANAQVSLQQSEAQLAQAKMGATPKEIAAARAKVESAQADYDKTLAGPDPDEVTSTKADLKTTELALRKAQEDYDAVAYRGDLGMTSQAETLQQASIDYEKALAEYNIALGGPTEEEKKAAAATLAEAEASLDSLLREPLAEDVAAAQAEVDKARVSLETARLDLQNAVLESPIDGAVVEVNVRVGEVPKESTAIILVDDSRLHVDVGVDEIDVSQIEVGQPVTVVLEALADEEFPGKVASISPATTDSETLLESVADAGSGVPTYIVSIDLEHTLTPGTGNSPKLRVGMSASAEIQTRISAGVPLIPNGAIQVDEATGQKYVNKLDGRGMPVRTEITTGLSDDEYTEVLSGLEVGDKVLIGTVSEESAGSGEASPPGPPMMFVR